MVALQGIIKQTEKSRKSFRDSGGKKVSDGLYDRQTQLPLLSYDTIIIVGVGGVGNWMALNAALCGKFNKLVLIDDDIVSMSNLNRTIFRFCDVGEYKVDAIKNQILERRAYANVVTYIDRTSEKFVSKLIETQFDGDNSYYHSNIVIVDCRDDIYDDLYRLNCKLYKVGYDGMNMTIDGNPRLTKVWTQRGGSYQVVPSYVGSAQLLSCLVLNDIICPALADQDLSLANHIRDSMIDCEDPPYVKSRPLSDDWNDELGRLNNSITFNALDILQKLNSDRPKYDYRKVTIEINECIDDPEFKLYVPKEKKENE